MSIRTKLTLTIFSIMLVILVINGLLYDLSLRASAEAEDQIADGLSKLWAVHIVSSLVVLLAVTLIGYVMAGYIVRPLNGIVVKVGDIANGKPGDPLDASRKDELGLLASQINSVSADLEEKTSRLQLTAEELQSTKAYLESFFNHSSDAIHVVDLDGRVLAVNNAFEDLYDWAVEEAVGRRLGIIPESGEVEVNRLIGKVLQGGQVAGYETVGKTKGGRPIDVSVTVSPIRDERGEVKAFASITRNMTDRKQTEELLRRSEKLSVVGQLAAGVAHEIRNPLTTLRGFVQLQQRRGEGNPHHLELMLSELDRINFIVSEFLILAKPQAEKFAYHDPRAILTEILYLIESQANMNNIEIRTEFDPDIPDIHCEINQLKQVFVNVLKNAMESMPDGGPVAIEIHNAVQKRVLIRIVDQGCGIPEEHLARLGEPFFTSKDNGNGLGLMVSQQIIANHKGNILIRSEPGSGTCVDIVLPVHT